MQVMQQDPQLNPILQLQLPSRLNETYQLLHWILRSGVCAIT